MKFESKEVLNHLNLNPKLAKYVELAPKSNVVHMN